MYEHLKTLRESLGMTQTEFGESVGVAKSTYNNYETGVRNPKSDFWIAVAQKYNVTIDYLMGFSEDPKKTIGMRKNTPSYTDEALKLAKDYDALDEWGQKVLRHVASDELERVLSEQAHLEFLPDEEGAQVESLLVYSNPAAAGAPLYAENDFERIDVPRGDLPPGTDFGVRISGKSMEPTIPDGSIVFVHKTVDIEHGKVGVFMINDSAVCKRVFKQGGVFMLLSDNSEYAPVKIEEGSAIAPVGVVLGSAPEKGGAC